MIHNKEEKISAENALMMLEGFCHAFYKVGEKVDDEELSVKIKEIAIDNLQVIISEYIKRGWGEKGEDKKIRT
jgi:hypothetical protein